MKDVMIILSLMGFGYVAYAMLSTVFGEDND